MPGSTISLESLSSPSPSPSPPPETHKPTEPPNTGLDSDSELSELTEEEQEAEKGKDVNSGRTKHDRRGGNAQRGSRARRGGRRKRSGIVPPPMWDWAETKPSNVVEEEEEEEMTGPPPAMEEEEGDEEGAADDEDDDDRSLRRSFSRQPTAKKTAREDSPAPDRHPEQSVGAVNGGDGYVSDERPMPAHRVRRSARTSRTRDQSGSRDDGNTLQFRRYDVGRRRDPNCDSVEDEAVLHFARRHDDDEGSEYRQSAIPSPRLPGEPAWEPVTDSDDEPTYKDKEMLDVAPGLEPAKTLKPISAAMPLDGDADLTALPASDVPTPSIMSAPALADPPSPSPSTSESRSPTPSRSPSPAPSAGPPLRGDIESKGEAKTKPASPSKVDASTPKGKDPPPRLDMDIDIPENDPDQDVDQSAIDVEADEPSLDDDLEIELESDLQPAHRAEALDVLATIELKFALLRERVYVEKMEGLAWEETLISDGSHPELLHLQRELSTRRDKRLELASRKRSYEVANINKRRRVDEDATWSWWKLARDELQTEIISETNRKRRRMERERRAMERPQPVHRIPIPVPNVPQAPSLRKIVKSFPINVGQSKRDGRSTKLKPFSYPELSTLSDGDINHDLEYLYHHRRQAYEMRHMNMNPHLGSNPQSHSYDPYSSVVAGSFGSRMQPPPHVPPFQHPIPPPLPPSQLSQTPGAPPAFNVPNPVRIHQQQHAQPPKHLNHHHGPSQYPLEQHDVPGAAPGPSQVPHPYFGTQGNGNQVGYAGQHQQQHQQHQQQQQHYPKRRSVSPANPVPNGATGKPNGSWLGNGMGMSNFPANPKPANDWMGEGRRSEINMMEEEERERLARERDKREREHQEHERDRQRESYHTQQHPPHQPQHRHPPSGPHHHIHAVPITQVQHHHPAHHHHHRHGHVHVVHHHHGQPSSGGSQMPSSLSAGQPLAPMHNSHLPREFDNNRPHNQHPTEVINLSSSKSIPPHWKADEHHPPPSDYLNRDSRGKPPRAPPHAPMEERDRPLAMPFVMASTHTMASSSSISPPNLTPNGTGAPSPRVGWNTPDDAAGFRLPTSSSSSSAPYHGTHDNHTHSPGHRYAPTNHMARNPPPSKPQHQKAIGHSPPHLRQLPPSPSSSSIYPNPHSVRSPTRFAPPPPLSTAPPNRSPPVSLKMRRPTSPPTHSTKMLNGPLPSGPPASSVYSPRLTGPGRTSTPTGPPAPSGEMSKNGSGGAPVGYGLGSRTASPLMPFPSPSTHSGMPGPLVVRPPFGQANGERDRERDRERERESLKERERHSAAASPRLDGMPPHTKMGIPQVVDGH